MIVLVYLMWGTTTMKHLPFFCLCLTAGLTASSSLKILDKRSDCNQQDLENCHISKCSDTLNVVPRRLAPNGPEWDPEHVGVWMDHHGYAAIVNVTWKIKTDGSVKTLRGSKINVVDESTNQSLCVQFSYKLSQQHNPNYSKWTFSLDGVMVEPGHTYMLSVINLPEPEIGDYRITKQIIIPGCSDRRIQKAQICLENGSLWDPHIITALSLHKERKMFSVGVDFETAQYSERYQVSIHSPGFHCSKNVSKENRTSLNVSFEFGWWQISQCEMMVMIQPFFVQCKNDCWRSEKTINLCWYFSPRTLILKATLGLLVAIGSLVYLLWRAAQKDPVNTSSSAAKQQPEGFQALERKRVLIIYSLDHPLYKNIVLKLCAFLATKCGTEVVLDLLDSTRLGVLGSIQWLDWIESSSDKILILCSRGVQAKWRAMCGGKEVFLREDACSPVGDMLCPALSLMVPHFIRSVSFEKYIVAYFDDVSCEGDIPSPFNITVRYKLMEQFEELFFRILDTEKHEPGRVNQIEGLSEDKYYHCPPGRALLDAIEAFHAYQLEHPQWFEDEQLESSKSSAVMCDDAKTTTNLITHSVPNSIQVTVQVNTQESDFFGDKTGLYLSESNPLIADNMQPV